MQMKNAFANISHRDLAAGT